MEVNDTTESEDNTLSLKLYDQTKFQGSVIYYYVPSVYRQCLCIDIMVETLYLNDPKLFKYFLNYLKQKTPKVSISIDKNSKWLDIVSVYCSSVRKAYQFIFETINIEPQPGVEKVSFSEIDDLIGMINDFNFSNSNFNDKTNQAKVKQTVIDFYLNLTFADTLVLKIDGKIVGYAYYYRIPPNTMFIDELYLVPSARYLGHGALLLNECRRIAWIKHYDKVMLSTKRNNYNAIRFYQKHGGKQKSYLRMQLLIGNEI